MAKTSKLIRPITIKSFLIIAIASFFLTPLGARSQMESAEARDSLTLRKFEGFYQLEVSKELYIQIKAEGNHLKLIQLWDYKEKTLSKVSDLNFEDKAKFKLTLSKNAEGLVTRIVANGQDVWLKDTTYKPEVVENLSPRQEEALKVRIDDTAQALIEALNSNSVSEIKTFVKAHVSESLLKSPSINFEDRLTRIYRLTGGVERAKRISFNAKATMSDYQAKGKYLNNLYDFNIKLNKEGKIKLFNNRLIGEPSLLEIQKGDKEIVQSLKSVLSSLDQKDVFSGTVLLAKGDKVLLTFVSGDADKEAHIKNTIDTRFNLGSMNKMFTALSIMQLVEKGKLDLSDRVSKFVDTTWLPKALSDKITIHHLLSHTSGIGDFFTEAYENAKLPSGVTLQELAPYIKVDKLNFEPGKAWNYSNAGMVLLGVVIQNVSGMSYYDYIRRYVYKPAGMTKSDVYDFDSNPGDMAIGYIPQADGTFENNRNSMFSKGSPAGGGYSTVHDLHKFLLSLNAGRLVTDSSKKSMFTNYMNSQYGYGFEVFNYKNQIIIGHAGGAPGINAVAYMEPKSKYIIIILGNYDSTVRGISDFVLNRIKANLD